MKTTITVVAGVSALFSILTSCMKEEPPALSDAPALPEGTITLDKAKAYFAQNSGGSVAALNLKNMRLDQTRIALISADTAIVLTKTFTTSVQASLPQWEQSVTLTNPKFSSLRVPLAHHVVGITAIGNGNAPETICNESDVKSYLIVQQMYGEDRMRQYVETVIKAGTSRSADSYLVITDVSGEYLHGDRWKNGKRTDMALLGAKGMGEQSRSLNGILQRSILDSFFELPEIGVIARPCPNCHHDPCTCCYRCGQYPCACCLKCFQFPCVCWVCPHCGSQYCDGKQCMEQEDKGDPKPDTGTDSDRPESPGFILQGLKVDTLTQKKINKVLKKIYDDCMGQKLLVALNYNFKKDLTIIYAPEKLDNKTLGLYSPSKHTITLGTTSLLILTEELFHAYQGYDPAKPYTRSTAMNYEVEAHIAASQVSLRMDDGLSSQAMDRANFDNECLRYTRVPTKEQYMVIVNLLRKQGYSEDAYPENPAYRNIEALKTLSSNCNENKN